MAPATCSSWALFVGGHQFLKHQLCKGVHHEIDPLVSTLFAGIFIGRKVIQIIPQRGFEILLYAFSTIAGLRLFFF